MFFAMQGLLKLLGSARAFVKALPAQTQSIHFILGNESCDLDSCIGALALGVLLSKRHPDRVVVPVMNVNRENFTLRTENCVVLNQAGISLCSLIFRDEVDFSCIIPKYSVRVSLVDHHILANSDQILASHVVEIFDHRPIDSRYSWDPQKVQTCIEPVGSCCTLIANCLLQELDSSVLTKALAYLLYQTIVYDTLALKPQNHKATALDIEVAEKLEKLHGFNEDPQVLFDRLWGAHNDVSHLTPNQLLRKDLKIVEGIYIPGLPMLVEKFLALEGALEAIETFAGQLQVRVVLLVGLDASKETIERDLAVYSKTATDQLGATLLEALECRQADFLLEEKVAKCGGNIRLMRVHNVRVSRKQLVPIVKEAWDAYINRPSIDA